MLRNSLLPNPLYSYQNKLPGNISITRRFEITNKNNTFENKLISFS